MLKEMIKELEKGELPLRPIEDAMHDFAVIDAQLRNYR
jgi:hypothetical protein